MLSTSSFSKTLIKENLSRHWAIPVIALIGYFLAGILPIIFSYKKFALVAEYATKMMAGGGIMINLIIELTAVITAASVFGYLHNPVSATAMHTMPVKRSGLFNSAAISGWIMMMAPIIILGFLTLTLRGASTPPNAVYPGDLISDMIPAKEIFTPLHVLGFIGFSAVTATYTYAVCCIAAVFSGSTLIHVLLSFFLLALPSALLGQINSVCKDYLLGFPGLDINYSLLGAGSYAVLKEGNPVKAGYIIYYLVLAAIMLVLAQLIYKKVKLERVGSACTFPVVADALCVILTFMGTVGFAYIFAVLSASGNGSTARNFIISALISSVAIYAVMRMIADSTLSVFKAKNIKKYAAALGVIVIFILLTVVDISGYSKRVPAADNIASVKIITSFPNAVEEVEIDFDDARMCGLVRDLQQAVIDERANSEAIVDHFELTYTLKNGRTINRKYDVRLGKDYKTTDVALKKLYETEEFRDKVMPNADQLLPRISAIVIYDVNYASDSEIREEDHAGLIDAVTRDRKLRTYEQELELEIIVNDEVTSLDDFESTDSIYVELEFKEKSEYGTNTGVSYIMNKSIDKNTFKFLEDKGYLS